MKHKGTIVIESKRLILRPFELSDRKSAFINWAGDDKVTEFLKWPTHKDEDFTHNVIKFWLDKYNDKSFYNLAIVFKEINEVIGVISIPWLDEKANKVHIGYSIGSKWWNRGIAREALAAIIPFLFEEVGVGRIEAIHDPNNPSSDKVMLKNGFTYEGTMRNYDFTNKGISDASIYSILSEEYFSKKY